MDKIDIHTPIIIGIMFNYFFLQYNKSFKVKSLIIMLSVNSFLIFDIINSLFGIWEDFDVLKNILVLCAVIMGIYISVKGYRNNTLVGAQKVFADMGFYFFIMMLIGIIILSLCLGYMQLMIYLKP